MFRLLGPVELWAGGRRLDAGPARQRAVLAVLAVEVGQPVTIDELVARVWAGRPPEQPRNAVYTYMTRIRRVLDQARAAEHDELPFLVRDAGAYRLAADPDSVDLHRFRRLVDEAGAPPDPDRRRADRLRRALDLWTGPPLAGVPGRWADELRQRWRGERARAAVAWAEIALRAGHRSAVIARLSRLCAEPPLVEPLVAVLMRALAAAGHETEALAWYERVRRQLADDPGTGPGAPLAAVHEAIRSGIPPGEEAVRPEPATARPEAARPGSEPARPAGNAAPAQLPLDVPGFTGRVRELAELDAVWAGGRDHPTATAVAAISGTAGVGKTALAVHWAQRVVDQFPDGQLYVNLRGFDPHGPPVTPAAAVRGFLDAFGVPLDRLPAGFEAQVGLYRTLLARRRVLVVLDNASDVDQIRPLLPGAHGCLVVVTSRHQLAGLAVTAGTNPIVLEPLAAAEARELLSRRAGSARVAAEPAAADEIVELCSRLPLALSIVGARAAIHRRVRLGTLADRMRRPPDRLSTLDGDDPVTSVPAAFSWSYRALEPEAARLFRRLGLHPGPHWTLGAAASLAGVTPSRARPVLDALGAASLTAEDGSGRFTMHDLLRAYAGERALDEETEADRRRATRRVLDYYLANAARAGRLLHPNRPPVVPPSGSRIVLREDLPDRAAAIAWFAAEHQVLVAAVQRGVDAGLDVHAWQLAWTLTQYYSLIGYWPDLSVQHTAIAAATRLADRSAQADIHRGLAGAYVWLGRLDDAATHLHASLRLCEQLGDGSRRANAHQNLGWLFERQGRLADALRESEQALELFAATEDRHGYGVALNAVGWYHAQLGDHRRAVRFCQQALRRNQELGDSRAQAAAWDSLGYAHHGLGQHRRAIACYRRALDLSREAGDRRQEADALDRLGDAHRAAGNPVAARGCWQDALRLLRELGDAETDGIGVKLRELDHPEPGGAGPDPAVLTPRQHEIAVLAARRLSAPQIAARLNLSARTVNNHLAHVYTALGVTGRAGLSEVLRDP